MASLKYIPDFIIMFTSHNAILCNYYKGLEKVTFKHSCFYLSLVTVKQYSKHSC